MRFAPFLLLALLVADGASAQRSQVARELRVLFVGNSLTYVNDLPGMVAELARADGAVRLTTGVIARPDYSLEDHLASGEAAARISAGGWDVVVLQQGPSALPESRAELIGAARRIATLCAERGVRVALYAVWPAADRRTAFDSVDASYATAADSVGGALLPVGRAWQGAWRRDASLPLYGADGFHPSPTGSYLAALVIYRGLTGRSPIGLTTALPVHGATLSIPAGQAAALQAAALEVYR